MSTALRRARVLLGTLVEVGVVGVAAEAWPAKVAVDVVTDAATDVGADVGAISATSAAAFSVAFSAAFSAIEAVQHCMSRFEAGSDISRFHALAVGESLTVHPHTATVLQAAAALYASTQGLFDITLGSAPQGWQLQGHRLTKHHAHVALDLGGIAKGHAVDCAVAALQAAGCTTGWVNAGGDLRAFGDIDLPIALRNEQQGGTHPFGTLRDGALATSHYGPGARSALWAGASGPPATLSRHHQLSHHVSVMAPQCLWADALTKVVALTGDPHHAALAAHGAQAWLH